LFYNYSCEWNFAKNCLILSFAKEILLNFVKHLFHKMILLHKILQKSLKNFAKFRNKNFAKFHKKSFAKFSWPPYFYLCLFSQTVKGRELCISDLAGGGRVIQQQKSVVFINNIFSRLKSGPYLLFCTPPPSLPLSSRWTKNKILRVFTQDDANFFSEWWKNVKKINYYSDGFYRLMDCFMTTNSQKIGKDTFLYK